MLAGSLFFDVGVDDEEVVGTLGRTPSNPRLKEDLRKLPFCRNDLEFGLVKARCLSWSHCADTAYLDGMKQR